MESVGCTYFLACSCFCGVGTRKQQTICCAISIILLMGAAATCFGLISYFPSHLMKIGLWTCGFVYIAISSCLAFRIFKMSVKASQELPREATTCHFIDYKARREKQEVQTAFTDSSRPNSKEIHKDVLLTIFKTLEPRDLIHVNGVCKQWREVSNNESLWENAYLNTYGFLPPKGNTQSWRKEYLKTVQASQNIARVKNPVIRKFETDGKHYFPFLENKFFIYQIQKQLVIKDAYSFEDYGAITLQDKSAIKLIHIHKNYLCTVTQSDELNVWDLEKQIAIWSNITLGSGTEFFQNSVFIHQYTRPRIIVKLENDKIKETINNYFPIGYEKTFNEFGIARENGVLRIFNCETQETKEFPLNVSLESILNVHRFKNKLILFLKPSRIVILDLVTSKVQCLRILKIGYTLRPEEVKYVDAHIIIPYHSQRQDKLILEVYNLNSGEIEKELRFDYEGFQNTIHFEIQNDYIFLLSEPRLEIWNFNTGERLFSKDYRGIKRNMKVLGDKIAVFHGNFHTELTVFDFSKK